MADTHHEGVQIHAGLRKYKHGSRWVELLSQVWCDVIYCQSGTNDGPSHANCRLCDREDDECVASWHRSSILGFTHEWVVIENRLKLRNVRSFTYGRPIFFSVWTDLFNLQSIVLIASFWQFFFLMWLSVVDKWTIGNHSIIKTTDFSSPKELGGQFYLYIAPQPPLYIHSYCCCVCVSLFRCVVGIATAIALYWMRITGECAGAFCDLCTCQSCEGNELEWEGGGGGRVGLGSTIDPARPTVNSIRQRHMYPSAQTDNNTGGRGGGGGWVRLKHRSRRGGGKGRDQVRRILECKVNGSEYLNRLNDDDTEYNKYFEWKKSGMRWLSRSYSRPRYLSYPTLPLHFASPLAPPPLPPKISAIVDLLLILRDH